MPVDKQVLLRYKVLNDCFRNPYREYTIEDLVDECSKAAMREEQAAYADFIASLDDN